MAIQETSTDPEIAFNSEGLERAISTFAKAQGITTQAGWTTFVNGLFAALTANEQTLLRGFFRNAPKFIP